MEERKKRIRASKSHPSFPDSTEIHSAHNMYEMQAKLDEIQKRKNADDWGNTQEDLLISWGEKAAGYRWLHDKSHDYYAYLNNMYAYPSIILSGICGVGGFSTLNETKQAVKYFFACLNMVVSMLSSLQKFNRSAETAEQHRAASVGYATFYRQIALQMSLPPEDRTNVYELLNQSRIEYDRLLAAAPDIPTHVIGDYRKNFKHVKNKPDVANGIAEIKLYDSNKSRKMDDITSQIETSSRLFNFMSKFKRKSEDLSQQASAEPASPSNV